MAKFSSETLQQLKSQIDLRELARRYTTLHGQGKELYGPCPRCGDGRDRLHIQQSVFFCRQCLPPTAGQGRHDVLDFLVFVGEARNFREAVDLLSGSMFATSSPVRQKPPSPESQMTYEDPEWQERVWQEVVRCHQLLLSEQGSLGQAYLQKRGLTRNSWQPALLGMTPHLDGEGRKGWAISIPWWYRGKVSAINYRFISAHSQRYMRYGYSKYYGDTILYAPSPKGADTLVITEGELNALSVWQATTYVAISLGSQSFSSRTIAALRDYAARYVRCKIWTDEPQGSIALVTALDGRGEIITANDDANHMLQQGRLQQILA